MLVQLREEAQDTQGDNAHVCAKLAIQVCSCWFLIGGDDVADLVVTCRRGLYFNFEFIWDHNSCD